MGLERGEVNRGLNMDSLDSFWDDCDLVERVEGRCGGRPTIKGTRIEPDTIVIDAELGSTPEEIQESFPHLPLGTIKGILDYAQKHQPIP
jgi:uncharacterized protein (DUF433 family)